MKLFLYFYIASGCFKNVCWEDFKAHLTKYMYIKYNLNIYLKNVDLKYKTEIGIYVQSMEHNKIVNLILYFISLEL